MGDWRHSGVYALHHVPTGLEYVGASSCVLRRLKGHRSISELRHGGEWKLRLKASILLRNHGDQCVCAYPDMALYSDDQIAALSRFDLSARVNYFRSLGLDCSFNYRDIVPLFIEAAPVSRLNERESHHFHSRKPALNAGCWVGYPIKEPKNENTSFKSAPRLTTFAQAQCVTVLTRIEAISSVDNRKRKDLSAVRARLSCLLKEQALGKALPAANELFLREMARFSSVLETCGSSPSDFLKTALTMQQRPMLSIEAQYALAHYLG